MCLDIPMKLIRLRDNGSGVGDIDGTLHDVDLSLIESPAIDDDLIVHAGFAIERLDEDEANKRLQLFEDLAAQS